tara:strand:- start:297 stop:1514 length:1218 start_codon:yes stop_codon:yes gene_type:complete
MFDQIGVWLMDRGLREAGVEVIVQGFGRRLVQAGVSLHRLSLGGMLLHPVFGALDVVWNARDDTVVSQMMPRQSIATEAFRHSPFYWAISTPSPFLRFPLGAGPVEPEFPIFERLRAEGVTDYLLFFESYGRNTDVQWADLPSGAEGIILSLASRRSGGFTDYELAYVTALMRPFALCVKSLTTHSLARALLDTYLGKYSGNRVLDGMVERGDGGMIDCVLFYCDLRESTRLAERLSSNEYLALINDYFDCTAGAVVEHGGEVLKFIGDAVLAIFPVDAVERPAVDMCRAAVGAARDAFSRAARVGDLSAEVHKALRFGISLHIGQVMYGNVGTDRRLDFTVIGPAVNQATRLEGLCKSLDTSLVASRSFADAHQGELAPLGAHQLAGLSGEIEVFTLPEYAPAV